MRAGLFGKSPFGIGLVGQTPAFVHRLVGNSQAFVRPRFVGSASLALLAVIAACSGPELPDSPDPPHRISNATLPPFGEESPRPSPGASGAPTPAPTGSPVVATAPRGGKLVKTGKVYLEFLPGSQNGKLLFYAFPYDERLAGLKVSTGDGSGTIAIDGGASKSLTPFLDEDRAIFFYLYPQVGGGNHTMAIGAKVKATTYSGTFTYP